MSEVTFEVLELDPSGSPLEEESFDDEDQALDLAESWSASGPWTQVLRVEGGTRTCVVAEHNRPPAERP